MTTASQLTLPGGRILDYCVAGATNGFPILFSHGNPGAWVPLPHLVEACQSNGFALITWSRPGFGDSTRREGRRVVDDVDNVQALLRHLGHRKFASMGWSAGGPHTLASAAKVDGCVAAVVINGLGPGDAEGLTWSTTTSKGSEYNRCGDSSEQAANPVEETESELQEKYNAMRSEMLNATAAQMVVDVKPEVDKQTLIDVPGLAQYVEDTFREALKYSMDGMVDDDLSFFKPWGFDIDEIKVPVFLYHGKADPSVHLSHAQWIASRIDPQYVTTHFEEGGGHISGIKFIQSMLDEIKACM